MIAFRRARLRQIVQIICFALSLTTAALPAAADIGLSETPGGESGKISAETTEPSGAISPIGRLHSASKTIRVTPDAPEQEFSTAPKASVRAASTSRQIRKFDYLKSVENQGISFVENRGQAAPAIELYARNGAKTLWLTRDRMVFDLTRPGNDGAAITPTASSPKIGAIKGAKAQSFERIRFSERLAGANPNLRLEPSQQLAGTFNYFTGNRRSDWHSGAHSYRLVTYRDAWKGVDLRLYGVGRDLEQEFVIKPGANPGNIRLALGGASGLSVDRDGSLVVHTAFGDLRQKAPFAYQTEDNKRAAVAAKFRIAGRDTIAFDLGKYDHARPLVIDPVLLYSTLLGGVHDDAVDAMAVDSAGNTYVTGWTASQNFPISANAYQTVRKDIGIYTFDLFVTKFSPSGAILYSTFVGGNDGGGGNDFGYGIAVDHAGAAYVTGQTNSSAYPTTAGALDTKFNGCIDGLLTKLSADGSSLVFSTYIGGGPGRSCYGDLANQWTSGVAVDGNNDVFITGTTGQPDFPTTPGAYLTTYPGNGSIGGMTPFVAEVAPDGSHFIYSTFLGGSSNSDDNGSALGIDSAGDAFIVGTTDAANFPTTAGAYQTTLIGSKSSFLARMSPDGSHLTCSTLLGGSGTDSGKSLALGSNGNVYFTGSSTSGDLPTTSGVFMPSNPNPGSPAVFAAQMTPDCTTLKYSTFIAPLLPNPGSFGNDFDLGNAAVAVDSAGDAFVGSETQWQSLPTTAGAIQTTYGGGGTDGYLVELNPSASSLLYASYLGGKDYDGVNAVGLDSAGNIYVAGATLSSNFPTTPNAFQTVFGGTTGQAIDGHDAFVAAIGNGALASITPTSGGNAGSVTVIINGSGFQTGAAVELDQGASAIPAEQVAVSGDGSGIAAVFELGGASPGAYDVKVTNPDGSAFVTPGGFTVVSGGGANVAVNVIGRSAVRLNSPSTYYVNVTNSGNDDVYGVLVTLIVSSSVTVQPGFTLQPPPVLPNGVTAAQLESTFPASAQATIEGNALTFLPVFLPGVAAGATVSLPFQLTATALGPFDLEASANAGWFQSLSAAQAGAAGSLAVMAGSVADSAAGRCASDAATPFDSAGASTFQDCFVRFAQFQAALLRLILEKAGILDANGNVDPVGLGNAILGQLPPVFQNWAKALMGPQPTTALGWATLIGGGIVGTSSLWGTQLGLTPQAALTNFGAQMEDATGISIEALGAFARAFAVVTIAAALALDITLFLSTTWGSDCKCRFVDCSHSKSCGAQPTGQQVRASAFGDPDLGADAAGICTGPNSVGSIDPNDKTGPAGAGSGHWIVGTVPLGYDVSFENEPTATAPAQAVVVTDQLDPTKVDLGTLSLGAIGFGSVSITPPPNSTNYATTVDLGAQGSVADLKVNVQGSLNPATGLLKWTFQSLDASTGLPPADPTVGFLPPDTKPPAGDGQVTFSVMPKAGLANGTTISNQATVVFDQNASIQTPTWSNAIAAPVPAKLIVNPAKLAFQREIVFGGSGAQSNPQRVTISNPKVAKGKTAQPILVENMAVSNGFFLDDPNGCASVVLNPGQSCTFQVAFDPDAAGKAAGQLTIVDNAGAGSQTVALVGAGVPGRLSFRPASIAFGAVAVGQSGRPQTLTILNKTKASATIGTLAPGVSDYALSSDNCSGQSLEAGTSCTVTVTFTPKSKGNRNSTLMVPSDSALKQPQSVGLFGVGK